ncbi:MAG TPA: LLM class flavin-dependent oxidoreductase [Cellulomonas sp.]
MSPEPARGWGLWLHGVRPVPELAALARHAERRGASAVFLADELLDRDLYVVLAAVAAATEHVLLVPAITNPYSRHPVTTAVALASLAELAPGRVVAGLGVGGNLVLRPLGITPERPYTALTETADVVGRLLDGERVQHHGEFTVDGAQVPWTGGRLPLAVAGRGPRVERYAAEEADWVILAGKPITDLPAVVRQVRTAPGRDGAGTGRGPARIAWNPAVAWRPQDVAALRAHFAYMTVDLPAAWRAQIGVGEQVVAALRAALAADGPARAADLVPAAVLDAFAILGDRAQVVARLREVTTAIRPELVVLDAGDYSTAFVDDLAELVADAGLRGAPWGRR